MRGENDEARDRPALSIVEGEREELGVDEVGLDRAALHELGQRRGAPCEPRRPLVRDGVEDRASRAPRGLERGLGIERTDRGPLGDRPRPEPADPRVRVGRRDDELGPVEVELGEPRPREPSQLLSHLRAKARRHHQLLDARDDDPVERAPPTALVLQVVRPVERDGAREEVERLTRGRYARPRARTRATGRSRRAGRRGARASGRRAPLRRRAPAARPPRPGSFCGSTLAARRARTRRERATRRRGRDGGP